MVQATAFIPARFDSTRLPGKPLKDICGKPMIRWVYERAGQASLLSGVAVATDDCRVFDAVTSFGGSVVMTSTEHTSGTDRVAEAAGGTKAEIVVNVQGDEPLIEPEMIDAVLRPLIDDPALLMSTLKTPVASTADLTDPNVVKVVTDKEGFALYFSRSAVPSGAAGGGAVKHIGLYAYRREFLIEFSKMAPTALEKSEKLEQLRVLENGYRIMVVETPFNPLAVDTEEDLEKVRRIIGEAEARG